MIFVTENLGVLLYKCTLFAFTKNAWGGGGGTKSSKNPWVLMMVRVCVQCADALEFKKDLEERQKQVRATLAAACVCVYLISFIISWVGGGGVCVCVCLDIEAPLPK